MDDMKEQIKRELLQQLIKEMDGEEAKGTPCSCDSAGGEGSPMEESAESPSMESSEDSGSMMPHDEMKDRIMQKLDDSGWNGDRSFVSRKKMMKGR